MNTRRVVVPIYVDTIENYYVESYAH